MYVLLDDHATQIEAWTVGKDSASFITVDDLRDHVSVAEALSKKLVVEYDCDNDDITFYMVDAEIVED